MAGSVRAWRAWRWGNHPCMARNGIKPSFIKGCHKGNLSADGTGLCQTGTCSVRRLMTEAVATVAKRKSYSKKDEN